MDTGKMTIGMAARLVRIFVPPRVIPRKEARGAIVGMGKASTAPKRTTLARCRASVEVFRKYARRVATIRDEAPRIRKSRTKPANDKNRGSGKESARGTARPRA